MAEESSCGGGGKWRGTLTQHSYRPSIGLAARSDPLLRDTPSRRRARQGPPPVQMTANARRTPPITPP